jgi:hypothetical protein
MKYSRPELIVSDDAIRVIQSHVKPFGMVDSPNTNPNKTSTAYEADE